MPPKHGNRWCSVPSRCHQVIPSPNCSDRSLCRSPYNRRLSAWAPLVLINSVYPSLPNIISVHPRKEANFIRFQYDSVLDQSLAATENFNSLNHGSTIVCWSDLRIVPLSAQLYLCPSTKTVILNYFLCNQRIDCTGNDTSDENECGRFQKKLQGHITCSPLLLTRRNGQCAKIIDKVSQLFVWRNYSSPATLKWIQSHSWCYANCKIPCGFDQKTCFDISDICKYYLTPSNKIYPCVQGGHLANCVHFECDSLFKYPQHYCISWIYVCNKRWDCPGGVEETYNICARISQCKGLFKCIFGSHTCIHRSDICDGKADCMFGEDETFCSLSSIVCPRGCECLVLAALCSNSRIYLKRHYPFLKISLLSVRFVLRSVLHFFQNATHISVTGTNLTTIELKFLSAEAIHLNLARNLLACVQFKSKSSVGVLFLQENHISSILDGTFSLLPCLKLVNISKNPISHFSTEIFSESGNVCLLSLLNISPTTESLRHFKVKGLKIIQATEHYFCCLNKETKCVVFVHWYESCANILEGPTLVSLFAVVCVSIFCVHMLSVVLHWKISDLRNAFKVIVIGYEVTETINTCCFVIILVHNHIFFGTYFLHAKQWRSGATCSAVFLLVLWIMTASPLSLLILTLARSKVVTSPVLTSFKKSKFAVKCVLCWQLASLLVGVSTTVATHLHYGLLPHKLCSPFLDNTKFILSVKVLSILFCILHTLFLVCNLCFHIVLIVSFKKTKQTVQSNENVSKQSKPLIIQLAMISTTNFLVLAPVSASFTVLLYIPIYPSSVPHWLTLAQPLHSWIISVIFIGVIISKHYCLWMRFSITIFQHFPVSMYNSRNKYSPNQVHHQPIRTRKYCNK